MDNQDIMASMMDKTVIEVRGGRVNDGILALIMDDGTAYLFDHKQDCCEDVRIEDVCGDLGDLLHFPIYVAEEVSESDASSSDSWTWTFYKFATIKGSLTVRWLGSSNGYYSESVDLEMFPAADRDRLDNLTSELRVMK